MHKKISVSLGAMILMFGLLKFVDPFKTWYSVQIQTSGLPEISYFSGIIGEIVVGLLLIFPFFLKNEKFKFQILSLASSALVVMMVVATYVHLLPAVPAEVLPLKIKPPVIPIIFLFAAGYNLYLSFALRLSLEKQS
ncbi:MAG: DoxX family membrane protein [Bacteriovoracia bacterium]